VRWVLATKQHHGGGRRHAHGEGARIACQGQRRRGEGALASAVSMRERSPTGKRRARQVAADGGLEARLQPAGLGARLAGAQMGLVGFPIRAGQLAVDVGMKHGIGFGAVEGHAAPSFLLLAPEALEIHQPCLQASSRALAAAGSGTDA
jgi:hypothetical protein